MMKHRNRGEAACNAVGLNAKHAGMRGLWCYLGRDLCLYDVEDTLVGGLDSIPHELDPNQMRDIPVWTAVRRR